MADQRWRDRPRIMPPTVVDAAARRIAEHAQTHRLPAIDVILHGGEPLLAGPSVIAATVDSIRARVAAPTRVRITAQTNGVRLDAAFLDLFADLDVRIGVSVDGDRQAHDRHRRRAGGESSYDAVARALRLLGSARYRRLFAGVLCVVDLDNDPVTTYEALLAYQPPVIDYLLPHGNWSRPPPGRAPDSTATPYADWLIAVFDRWYFAPRHEVRVRLFEEIIQVLLGGVSRLEGIGATPLATVVVETDGGIDSGDTVKSAIATAATGLHVGTDSFDQVLRLPEMRAHQAGLDGLAPACRSCPVRRVCGGGLYAHRYRIGSGFDNASVYSPDLYRLITHIRTVLAEDLQRIRGPAR